MMREDRSWAEKQTFKRKGIKVKEGREEVLVLRYAPPFRGENTRSQGNNGPRWGPSVVKKKKKTCFPASFIIQKIAVTESLAS